MGFLIAKIKPIVWVGVIDSILDVFITGYLTLQYTVNPQPAIEFCI